jgi:hypothetical protein
MFNVIVKRELLDEKNFNFGSGVLVQELGQEPETIRGQPVFLPMTTATPASTAQLSDLHAILDDPSTFKDPREKPIEIIPKLLYIGNVESAYKLEKIKALNISHVVCCAANDFLGLNQEFYGTEVKWKGFAASDSEEYPILQHLDDVLNAIEEAQANSSSVLVHCAAGVNRR